VKNGMSGTRIDDAVSAQAAVRRHLEAQYGTDKINNISFSRSWFTPGTTMEVWEVDGEVIIKKGLFSKEHRHFKYQIDSSTGRVIGYEG